MHQRIKSSLIFLALLAAAVPTLATEPGDDGLRAVLLQVPDPCTAVERVEGTKVFLVRTAEVCAQNISLVEAEVPKEATAVELWLDGKLLRTEKLQSYSVKGVNSVLEAADKAAPGLGVNPQANVHQAVAKELAKVSGDALASEERVKKQEAEVERIKQILLPDPHYADGKAAKPAVNVKKANERTGGQQIFAADERLYLFISSSVPLPTLRAYAAQIAAAGDTQAVMVMRGFIGGMTKIKPTIDYIQKVILKDTDCSMAEGKECEVYPVEVLIDPMLFTRYHVDRVPALVYAQGVSPVDGIDFGGSEGAPEFAAVAGSQAIFGDAGLDFLVEKLGKQTGRDSLSKYAKALRGGFYGGR